MNLRHKVIGLAISAALLGNVGQVNAVATFFGPTPYLSTADIPAGFYVGGSPAFLEDFEDGSLDGGITASAGMVIPPGFPSIFIDSVDADNGAIDGSGLGGHSWFVDSGLPGVDGEVIYGLPAPVTAAGIVWTDGSGTATFEAFADTAATISLGILGPFSIGDGTFVEATAEDRFFGVQDPSGIGAIKISNTFPGMEVDHLQIGSFVVPAGPTGSIPEPITATLALMGLATLGIATRRRAA